MGNVRDGCVSVNDIARTHTLQATDAMTVVSMVNRLQKRGGGVGDVATTVSPTSAAGARRMCAAAVIAATAAATWSIRRRRRHPLFA